MKAILEFVKTLWRVEEGASAVEYGVLVALIIAACVIVINALGTQFNTAFQSVITALEEVS